MASKKETQPITSKRDLERVLTMLWHSATPKEKELDEKHRIAYEAVDKFLESDPTYKKLVKERENARTALDNERTKREKIVHERIRKCQKMLYTRGVTEAVIKEIEQLMKDFPVDREGNRY